MKTIVTSIVALGLALALGAATAAEPVGPAEPAAGDRYWERVQAGFDNMLNHQPYGGPTGVTVQLPAPDPVADIINNGFAPRDARFELAGAGENKL